MRDADFDKLQPWFARCLQLGLDECHKAGLEIYLFEGFRSHKRQKELYNQGRTLPGKRVTNAKPGQSWHQFGLAADLVFRKGPVWLWSGDYASVGKIMSNLGFEWARTWRRFPEDAHFQMTFGLSIEIAQELYEKGGVAAVWSHLITSSSGES